MNSTLSERGPQFFSDGPITLAIGRDAAITHWEMLGHMSADRLPADTLSHGLHLLNLAGEFPEDAVVSVFVTDSEPMLFEETPPEIPARRVLIVEAIASVWQTRIQDISDASAPLYQAAVEELGRLEISGRPYLNELLAQRRRVPVSVEQAEVEVLQKLVHELRQSVVFGAAGFMAAEDEELKTTTQKALAPDGWMHELSLLVATEECLAAALLAQIRSTAGTDSASLAQVGNFILLNRAEDITLATQLAEVVERLQDLQLRQRNLVKKIFTRSQMRMLDGAVHALRPFVELRQQDEEAFPTLELVPGKKTVGSEQAAEANSGAAAEEVFDAELVEEFDAEELAEAFGELFGTMLPAAQAYAEKLRADHPRDSAEEHEKRASRRFLDLASGKTVDTDHGYLQLDEAVALYAMTLAVLREIPVDKPNKRQRQAKQLGLVIAGYGTLQDLPGNKLILNGIGAAQRAITGSLLQSLGSHQRFPKLAVVARLLENLSPAVDDRLVADKVLHVVNRGALKIIASMVEKAIR